MSDSHIDAILLELYMKWIDFVSPYLKIESQHEWQAHFGVSPLSLERISNICPYLKPKSLLMDLNFLKVLLLEMLSSMLGSKRSWTAYVWKTLETLYENLDAVQINLFV
jgi:hypothetical protein